MEIQRFLFFAGTAIIIITTALSNSKKIRFEDKVIWFLIGIGQMVIAIGTEIMSKG